MAIMFKVGNLDFSNRVLSGSYNVQNNDMFESWTDANGKEHRSSYRKRMGGSFDMLFKTIDEFKAFNNHLALNKNDDLTYPITALDNLTSEEVSFVGFINFSPTRRRNELWKDMVDVVTISILES